MKLSEITTTLREIGVSPVKSLGQNFLHDKNLARWIVEQAKIGPKDFAVEIGPGLGALTEFALEKGARVLAIEKDKRLVEFLRKRFANQEIEFVHGDALEFDTRPLFTKPRVKLFGNLPYYISSQLLVRFLEFPSPISLWLLMLQKELAKRLSAPPATSDYGALTLQIQLHYRVEYLRTIPATVFLPKPDVDSAIIRVSPRGRNQLAPCDHKSFERLVRLGFSQRRKQLGKLIRNETPAWEAITVELGLNPRARAEELSLEQWIALTNRIAPIVPAIEGGKPEERFQVVDNEDRPIAAVPRSRVHANNLLHRAVHVLISNSAGEIFLQLRSRLKDRHPLTWDSSTAGHVNAGEDYDQTAVREVQEELGIETSLERIGKLPASKETDQEFVCVYRGRYDGELRPNATEIEAGRFFSPAIVNDWIEARPRDFAPGFVECWKIWREKASAPTPTPARFRT
jgi:16S rRNA (adenine1518-N6/adenine1519-N6)-dimethyltransferase